MQESEIIERIKSLCEARSWTFYRLAKESGITYSTLCTMLHKANTPSFSTLAKICNGFGITLSEFFNPNDKRALLTEEHKKHLEQWEELTPENREAVAKFIDYLLYQQQNIF